MPIALAVKIYYFKEDGSQVKGDFVKNADGSLSYYDKDSGERLNNRFLTTGNNVWVLLQRW